MRESHGPRWSKVAFGISLERIEFSTDRMAERGIVKRSSFSERSCAATEEISLTWARVRFGRGRRVGVWWR